MFTKKVCALFVAGVVAGCAVTGAWARNLDTAGSGAAQLLAQITAVRNSIVQSQTTLGALRADLVEVNAEIFELMTGSAGDVPEEVRLINLQQIATLQAEAAAIENNINEVQVEIAQLQQTYQALRALYAHLYGGATGAAPTPDRV